MLENIIKADCWIRVNKEKLDKIMEMLPCSACVLERNCNFSRADECRESLMKWLTSAD